METAFFYVYVRRRVLRSAYRSMGVDILEG